MLDLNVYKELNLNEQKEYVEKILNYEFELTEDFDGILSNKNTVIHKKCGQSQNIRIVGLLVKKNKCDHCFNIEKTEKMRKTLSPQLELLGKYINIDTPVKVRIKRCNHITTVVPHAAIKSIKRNKPIKCKECIYEQKKKTLEKYIKKSNSYEGEYSLYKLEKEPHKPIGVIHNKCGEVEYYNYKQIVLGYVNCTTCKLDSIDKNFISKLKLILPDYKLKSKYLNGSKPIILEHICGCEKYILPNSLNLNTNIKCRWCDSRDFYNIQEVKKYLYYLTKGEYQIYKDEYDSDKNILYLKKKSCNHMFSIKSKKFFNNIHCPVCKKEKEREKKHKEFVNKMKDKYENSYKVMSKFKTYKSFVDILHVECGHLFSEQPKILLAQNIKEPCPKCNVIKDLKERKNIFEVRLEKKFNGNIVLLSDFTNQKEEHLFKDNRCGNTFTDKPYLLIKRKIGCKICKE